MYLHKGIQIGYKHSTNKIRRKVMEFDMQKEKITKTERNTVIRGWGRMEERME
jgi:hypothetical protein